MAKGKETKSKEFKITGQRRKELEVRLISDF
jgi:hypothetical protein